MACDKLIRTGNVYVNRSDTTLSFRSDVSVSFWKSHNDSSKHKLMVSFAVRYVWLAVNFMKRFGVRNKRVNLIGSSTMLFMYTHFFHFGASNNWSSPPENSIDVSVLLFSPMNFSTGYSARAYTLIVNGHDMFVVTGIISE